MDMPTRAWPRGIGATATIALVAMIAISVSIWIARGKSAVRVQTAAELPPYRPIPVAAHRSQEIPDGFRGDVHPVLHGKTRLEVAAHWTPVGRGRDQLERTVPPYVYQMFTDLKPQTARQVYTEHEFSALMPKSVESVGQVWAIGLDDAARFLRQFHARPAMHLVAFGRRAGPDGAFAILRAVSPTHLDIVLRVHAEFDVTDNVWLTPACFWGRMVVNKEAGTVESFRMWVPTDNPLNIHLTVAESMGKGESTPSVIREIERGDVVIAKRDIVRIEVMELASENRGLPDDWSWRETIDMASAQRKLKSAFYAFADVNWVPWDQAVTVASEQGKPILAIVLWGALDDQSC